MSDKIENKNSLETKIVDSEIYESISSKIYEVRGVKVMLDFELAEIYGYETRSFNQQVKNNIDKFDETFRFRLAENEWKEILKSKISTSSLNEQNEQNSHLISKFLTSRWGGRRKLPNAFTEEGIYMLMTILKGELATKQSIMLIKTFKRMKDFIVDNSNLLTYNEIHNLSTIVRHHDEKITNLEMQFNEITNELNNKKVPTHYLILNGQRLEADVAYQSLYRLARHCIFIIDDYIDVKTLQLLKCCNNKIKIVIFTDNKSKNSLSKEYIVDFKADTNHELTIKKNGGHFHDRYIVIDFGFKNEIIYHSGGSSKDAGNGIMTIDMINDTQIYDEIIGSLLINEDLVFSFLLFSI